MISIYTLIPINRFEQLLNNLENKNKCRECNFIQKQFFWNHYKIGKFFLFCFIIVFFDLNCIESIFDLKTNSDIFKLLTLG
jgi:hypothetical protein